MSDSKRLQSNLQELIEAQPNDERLRDHLEGTSRNRAFPGLTWFWGPLLYERNRAMFRGLILNHFSDWDQTSRSWKRIKWSEHADRLEAWLKSVRANRDTRLAQRLLRWKYAGKNWGIDPRLWCSALLHDYTTAPSSASRAIVFEEYDDWFQQEEVARISDGDRLFSAPRSGTEFRPNFWRKSPEEIRASSSGNVP